MSSNASTSIPGTSPGEKEDNTQPDSSSARTEEENSEVPTIKSSEAKTSSSHIIMLAAEMKQAISRFLTEADFNNFASTSQIIRSAIKTDDRLSVVFGGTSGVQESDLPSLNENAPRVSHLHLKAIHRLKELPYFPNLDTFHVMKSASPNNEDWSASASDVESLGTTLQGCTARRLILEAGAFGRSDQSNYATFLYIAKRMGNLKRLSFRMTVSALAKELSQPAGDDASDQTRKLSTIDFEADSRRANRYHDLLNCSLRGNQPVPGFQSSVVNFYDFPTTDSPRTDNTAKNLRPPPGFKIIRQITDAGPIGLGLHEDVMDGTLTGARQFPKSAGPLGTLVALKSDEDEGPSDPSLRIAALKAAYDQHLARTTRLSIGWH